MQNAERIDSLIARLLPDIEARLFRPNTEVAAAVMATGWTRERMAQARRQRAMEPAQYEMRL